jgi:hypothetical protein
MREHAGEYQRGHRPSGSRQGLLLTLIMAGALACQGQADPTLPGTPAQQREIQALLRQNPGWRLATVADHTGNPEEVKRIQADRPRYSPYFATAAREGGDGPFAVALVRDTVFRVLYFPYRDRTYGRPVEVAKAGWFREASIALHGDTLRIAPYRSDLILDFVWSDSARKFLLLKDSSESDP